MFCRPVVPSGKAKVRSFTVMLGAGGLAAIFILLQLELDRNFVMKDDESKLRSGGRNIMRLKQICRSMIHARPLAAPTFGLETRKMPG